MPNLAETAPIESSACKARAETGEVLSSVLRKIIATRALVQISDGHMIYYGRVVDMDFESIEVQLPERVGQSMIVTRRAISLIRDLGMAKRRFPFSMKRYRYKLYLSGGHKGIS